MARITTNTNGTQPCIVITSNVSISGNSYTPNFADASDIILPSMTTLTVTNKTGEYSYVTFSDSDMRKLSTPADNSISTSVILDDTTWFGTNSPVAGNAASQGIQYISGNKILIGFKVYWQDNDGEGVGAKYRQGVGFITNLATAVTPDKPVWESPLDIAVDGSYTFSQNS